MAEKAMAPHSSTLAWKIPWMEEPGRLQSMRSRRVGHDWVTSLSLFTFMHWRRKWPPTPVFLPGESQGRGAWWAAVYGVAQSRTWLKRLSSITKYKYLADFLAFFFFFLALFPSVRAETIFLPQGLSPVPSTHGLEVTEHSEYLLTKQILL